MICAKVLGEWNAGEVFAPGTVVDRGEVEDNEQDAEDEDDAKKTEYDEDSTSCP